MLLNVYSKILLLRIICTMKSKEKIRYQFTKLYSKKDYNSITVKELCKDAGVARTTFYSNYQNIDEVKSDIEDSIIDGICNASKNIYTEDSEKYFVQTMEYIKENHLTFYAFLVAQPNSRFIKKFKIEIMNHFEENFIKKSSCNNYDLELEVVASAIVGYYTYWLENSDNINLSQIHDKFEIIKNALNLIF